MANQHERRRRRYAPTRILPGEYRRGGPNAFGRDVAYVLAGCVFVVLVIVVVYIIYGVLLLHSGWKG